MLIVPALPLTALFDSYTQRLGVGVNAVPTQLDRTDDGAVCKPGRQNQQLEFDLAKAVTTLARLAGAA